MSARVGQIVFGLLASDLQVQATLGYNPVRLFPNRIPGNLPITYPVATYHVVTDTAVGSLDGWRSGLRLARVQVDCYSPAYEEAQAAGDAVEGVLMAYQGERFKARRSVRRDLWDATGAPQGLHRVSLDFQCGVAES